ncbi:MAG: isoaspartyl peptidase/L-asparaginase family protein [Fidelibacterota bacterium]
MNETSRDRTRVRCSGTILKLFVLGLSVNSCTERETGSASIGFVVHGGAGTITRQTMTQGRERAYREKLSEALSMGYTILKDGGRSLNAVEAAIRILEDSPLFNAGKGAVFTNSGTNELDASIMDGRTLKAGAVAAVKHVKNPIALARSVMERSWHVMIMGEGAETFAREQGFELVPEDYFYTERRWKQLQKIKEKEGGRKTSWKGSTMGRGGLSEGHLVHGTVGAVALDRDGNLAAGTSTGGLTNKKFGRVGDSPVIGAGTYANNRTCAVSGTGSGEYFMRSLVAYDISALMEYGGMSLRQAAEKVVMEKLVDLGGSGGIIAIDSQGNVAMPFNTEGMYRGYVDSRGEIVVKIYRD